MLALPRLKPRHFRREIAVLTVCKMSIVRTVMLRKPAKTGPKIGRDATSIHIVFRTVGVRYPRHDSAVGNRALYSLRWGLN
jgi:hypothetical protein